MANPKGDSLPLAAENTNNWTVPGRFSKDPRYLHNYQLKALLFFTAVDLLLGPSFYWEFHWSAGDFVLPLLGLYLGALSIVAIHNATHGSFRPRWLNAWMGELAGSLQPHGFPGWRVAHQIHHNYPDDPVLDPHFPGKKSFWQFARQMTAAANVRIVLFYFRRWPQTPENLAHWKRVYFISIAASLARGLAFFLCLGPKNFILWVVPAYLGAAIFQTHFNFATHRPTTEGKFEILNLNHNWIYKLMNQLLFGIYFHKNHHKNERLFNPSHL